MVVTLHPSANMGALFFLLLVSLIVSNVVVLIEARFIVEKNSISVLSPYSLHSKHDASIGNFGVPDYGGSLVGTVVYPNKGANGCKEFDGDKPFKSKAHRPNILLLDRGECYFALKVWNGQQAGAAAVLVADSIDESLITMDSPEESTDANGYIEKIGIPSALIGKSFGDTLKEAHKKGEEVVIKMDWTESMPHPDQRVEYELWTNSNDECGVRCDEQMNFIKNFKGHAQILEKGGYTMFTPHYITWYCPEAFILSSQCKSQCINHGRYCAPDPEQDFGEGYQGKDVVFENLRQLCVHRVANQSNRSLVWWDYVTDFHIRCSMKQKRYSKECAEEVMKSLDLPVDKIKKCMGDPEANVENEVLKAEQDLQVGRGPRGDVTILPTMVINDVQYRGKLERTAVLKAICAVFKETTEPSICLSGDLETNQCLERNGGCWRDPKSNITACKDTFRGRVCECPLVNGVQYKGDGYTSCEGERSVQSESTLSYKAEWVSVLEGTQEASYFWVALNYLYGNLGKNYSGTIATIDLGGGSVQIAYAVSRKTALSAPKLPNGEPYVQQKSLLGTNYYLYVHSFLNYGLLAARADILKASKNSTSPCIVEGHNGYYTYNGVAYKAAAQDHGPNVRRCKAIIRKLLHLDAPCNHNNCSFAGVWNGGDGPGTKNLYVSSFFYDIASEIGIVDPKRPSGISQPIQYYKAAKLACQTKKQNMKSVFPNIVDKDIPFICMDLMYEYTLLVHGFGIDPYRKITVVHQVNYKNHLVEAAWPLGSAIDAVSSTT